MNNPLLRVLFVERDKELRQLYRTLFEVYGCEAELVRTGEEAITMATEFKPHAVYASLILDGMTGLELATRLRRLDFMRDAVLVALTGYAEGNIEAIVENAGFNYYLLKPVSLHKLLVPLMAVPGILLNEVLKTAIDEAKQTAESHAYAEFRMKVTGSAAPSA